MLRLDAIFGQYFLLSSCPSHICRHLRVVCLESASGLGIVGLRQSRLKGTGASGNKMVLDGGLVNGIANPGVPSGLDLGGVVVVLGVLDPAGAEREFLHVFEELVSGAVLADQSSGFGVAWA